MNDYDANSPTDKTFLLMLFKLHPGYAIEIQNIYFLSALYEFIAVVLLLLLLCPDRRRVNGKMELDSKLWIYSVDKHNNVLGTD